VGGTLWGCVSSAWVGCWNGALIAGAGGGGGAIGVGVGGIYGFFRGSNEFF
jgi:hypothetical protein